MLTIITQDPDALTISTEELLISEFTDNWILSSAFWDDRRQWDDSANWID